MRLTVHTSERHKGKTLEVDCEQETIATRDVKDEHLATITWESLIDFITSSTEEEQHLKARAYPRAPLAVKVRYTTEEGKQFESLTGGLGGGGLFIESSAPLAPGSELTVDFALPDRPTERMTAKARVAWVRSKAERFLLFPGMGVQFTDISSESRTRVQELVEALNRSRQAV